MVKVQQYTTVTAALVFLLTLGVVRQSEETDARSSGSGSEHGHPVWVSSEGRDVLLDPAQSLDLVQ